MKRIGLKAYPFFYVYLSNNLVFKSDEVSNKKESI
ncbi:MAG: hypothetical protein ACI8VZ_000498, partial [Candidatus Paceibacteria bacterium]